MAGLPVPRQQPPPPAGSVACWLDASNMEPPSAAAAAVVRAQQKAGGGGRGGSAVGSMAAEMAEMAERALASAASPTPSAQATLEALSAVSCNVRRDTTSTEADDVSTERVLMVRNTFWDSAGTEGALLADGERDELLNRRGNRRAATCGAQLFLGQYSTASSEAEHDDEEADQEEDTAVRYASESQAVGGGPSLSAFPPEGSSSSVAACLRPAPGLLPWAPRQLGQQVLDCSPPERMLPAFVNRTSVSVFGREAPHLASEGSPQSPVWMNSHEGDHLHRSLSGAPMPDLTKEPLPSMLGLGSSGLGNLTPEFIDNLSRHSLLDSPLGINLLGDLYNHLGSATATSTTTTSPAPTPGAAAKPVLLGGGGAVAEGQGGRAGGHAGGGGGGGGKGSRQKPHPNKFNQKLQPRSQSQSQPQHVSPFTAASLQQQHQQQHQQQQQQQHQLLQQQLQHQLMQQQHQQQQQHKQQQQPQQQQQQQRQQRQQQQQQRQQRQQQVLYQHPHQQPHIAAAVNSSSSSSEGLERKSKEPLELKVPVHREDVARGSDALPSLGSEGHHRRDCKPCAFLDSRKGCVRGFDCPYCHLCEPGEKKRRQKDKRKMFCSMRQVQQIASCGG